jgi:hypothetical protein
MPRGSRPGERRGGRKPGIPNRTTTERAEIARLAAAEANASGRKLGKEVLERFMVQFGELASYFQPTSFDTTVVHAWAGTKNYELFVQFAALARDTAKMLAPYQSPTFRSIELAAPAPEQGQLTTRFTLSIFDEDLRTKTIEQPRGQP